MADKGDRLTQAVALEKKAREHEAKGEDAEAFREYQNCLQVFQFVYKYEQNPRVKEMLHDRIEDLVTRAEKLKERLQSGEVRPAAGAPSTGATAVRPPAPPGAAAPVDEDQKEKERLKHSLMQQIVTEKPNIRWDDVAGLTVAKEMLQETVIMPTRFPQLFTGKRRPWKGILLYGPPGTGKSHLARACATEVDATFFSISSSDLVSKWMGESEKTVRSLFELARDSKSSIIFIDEVDSLAGARGESGESEAARRIKTEFLAQMDGVGKGGEGSQVLVLGATNTPWDLDTAIRRRFEKRVYIPLPDTEARTRLLEIELGKTPNTISRNDLSSIAQRTEGYSGADISILTKDAIYEPLRRCSRARTFKQVTKADASGVMRQYWTPCSPGAAGATEMTMMQINPEELLAPDVMQSDFEQALERNRPSANTADIAKHESWTSEFGMEG